MKMAFSTWHSIFLLFFFVFYLIILSIHSKPLILPQPWFYFDEHLTFSDQTLSKS